MLVYILKFSACLGIFLAFYKLFLERENMHQFKRFYLVSIVLTSIVIPFITFTEYIEPQPILDNINATNFLPTDIISGATEYPINYLPIILWSIYGLGVLLFGLKFGYNLVQLIFKIKKNPKQKTTNFINVLLNDLVTPHTFFSYIFLNKHKYETHQIPHEVLLHEQTHAKQKHSLDVLFVEVLQIIFWFNPIVYLIKNSIKLNHEFLADQAVLNNGIQPKNYQHILLAFSANNNEPRLANAINYSSIKKRLTVMKTQTSKQKAWLRSFILLPLLALTLYSFSDRKEIVREGVVARDVISPYNNSYSELTARSIDLKILSDGNYLIDNIEATKNTLVSIVNTLHQDVTPEVRNKIMNIHISSSNEISNKDVWFIYNSLLDYGFYRIVTDNQEVNREKGNTPFAITNSDTSEYGESITEKQDGATREQMKEYEKLAKHYNSMPKNKRVIKQKDVERMEYIYRLMSDKQKKDTEPFPNIPPPPATLAKNAPEVIEIEEVVPPPPPPPPLKQNATDAEKKRYHEAMKQYKLRASELNKTQRAENIKQLKLEKQAYQEARAAKIKEARAESIKVRELKSQKELIAVREARTDELKKEKAKLVKVRELRSEEMKVLKEKKAAYNEARVKKLKADKGELVRVREIKSQEEALIKLKKEKLAEREAQIAKRSNRERLARVKEIKAPKPPKSTLDHTLDMAKKGAIFYLEGKEISSDEAIKTLKKNKSLNIETIGSDSRQPKVYITKKPIVIEN